MEYQIQGILDVLAGSRGCVTIIFHHVQLLPAQANPRPEAINNKVDKDTALRTGTDPRSERTFADLTITRLGESTIFSFNRAGRSARFDIGSISARIFEGMVDARETDRSCRPVVYCGRELFCGKPAHRHLEV